jgi:hypothetical protein
MTSERTVSLAALGALAVSLAMAAPIAAADAPREVRLRYGLRPSSAYDQQGSIALDLAIDAQSLPEAMRALAQSALGEARQEIRIKGRLEVQPRATDGTIPFTFRVVDAVGTLLRGADARPLPGVAGMVGRPPVEARFSADGRRVEFAPAAGTQPGRPDRARDQLAQSLPELPEKALKVGGSFEALVPVVLPGAGGRGEDRVEARWIYTLRSIEAHRALFDVRQVLPTGTATATQGRAYTIAGGAVGKAAFDLDEGLFTDISLDTDMAITVNMPMPPGFAPPGTGQNTAPGAAGTAPADPAAGTLTLGSKVTGPIAVSMSRAAAAAN